MGPATSARSTTAYAVRAAVLLQDGAARGLAPHWDQVRLTEAGGVQQLESADRPGLLLLQLPDSLVGHWWAEDAIGWAAERGVPIVLWDTSTGGVPRPDRAEVLRLGALAGQLATVSRSRATDYAADLPDAAVWHLPEATDPARHLPGGRTGARRRVEVLPDAEDAAHPGRSDQPTPATAYDLAAAGVALVSAPNPALELDLDGAVRVADPGESRLAAAALRRQPEVRDRQAHLARRAVLLRHTWAVRAGQVLRQLELPAPAPDRSVSAVVPTVRPWQLDHVLETLAAQRHPDVELVLVTHGFQAPAAEVLARAADLGLDHVQVLHAASDLTLGACLNLGVAAASGRYTAKMDDDNLYGPHYLLDLVLAFEHTSAQVVGKWAHYVHLTGSDAVLLRFAGQEHREVDLVQGGTIVMPTDLLRELGFADLPRRVDTTLLKRVRAGDGRIWSADRFNFVSRRAADTTGHTWGITDQELLTRASSVVFYGDPTRHTTL